ncbi:uncharacterized protein MYCFIDRAFT_152467 [Pseudocercospora fijiensis CIRAD86]|uniref:Non-haem dioxygenase N-terminal domain-containing protein n=1 Tax=Pseudocercospora fijiensis (strain CIRAD86) TaxID=383855 RepID=M3B4E7_PSEFD|nr:uncharacterized protein MYCFIDRAFT_152467 [Pseudocercospora fijiensis CIRAD86]EME84217.1 hypothetical protein MYCFIDRAFT_152467 [Pseudocercospora fijiensis CIRAD86]
MGSVESESEAPHQAVSVSLQSLKSGTVSLETLEQAFGPSSLGIILVSDLPPKYLSLRKKLLSYSSYLANLPASELQKVEIPSARYNIGWSCGKETLSNGKFDTLKGSYYVQPIHNAELEEKARREYGEKIPDMTTANVWPDEAVLPGFEQVMMEVCELIVDVAGYVARSCDRYGKEKLEGYREGTLEEIVRGSVSTKARLLHYFPPPEGDGEEEEEEKNDDDDWCGTHHDLGALTGLTSNMYVDEHANPPYAKPDGNGALLPDLPELETHPDSQAGLWIKDRSGKATQVHIPRDCLAFQTGEALQMITRGKFRAVPHFVRGSSSRAGGGRIARNTLAVFTQPNLWEVVDEETGLDFAGLCGQIFSKTY